MSLPSPFYNPIVHTSVERCVLVLFNGILKQLMSIIYVVYFLHSKSSVDDVRAKGLICILDVEIQGVKNIKETDLDPIYVSIQPPSIEILVKSNSEFRAAIVRIVQ